MMAFFMLAFAILIGLAIAAAQTRASAVFARGMLFSALVTILLLQVESPLVFPMARLSRMLAAYAQFEHSGLGVERTLSYILGRIHMLLSLNVALVIGALTGWFAVLVDRRSETVEPSTSQQSS
jgi:hypothetical protein